MTPIQIEVVFPLLTSLEFGCKNCSLIFGQSGLPRNHHNSSADEYPEDWKEDVKKLHEWMANASKLYKHRIRIRLIDAQSPLGIWKQIRHRFSKLPGFVVDRSAVHIGWDTDRLESIIDERIKQDAERLAEKARKS
jgi:hypothetical protein